MHGQEITGTYSTVSPRRTTTCLFYRLDTFLWIKQTRHNMLISVL